jgi:hypothetical protein
VPEKGNHMKSIDVETPETDFDWGDDTGVELHYVTPEESAEILDRQARKYLGMSGEEFVRLYEAGELDDDDYDSNVMRVSMLIPLSKSK